MKYLFVVTFLLYSMAVQAGREIGNGGDIIVCKNSSDGVESTQLLDYFEALELGIHLQYQRGANHNVVINKILKRLSRWSPARLDEYREVYQEIKKNTEFVNYDLPDVPDSGSLVLPVNCDVKQLAFQFEKNGETHLVINKPLWDKADVITRAGLFFHELVYHQFKMWNLNSSIEVRNFHRLVLSDKFILLRNQREWFEALDKAKVPATDACGGFYVPVNLRSSSIRFGDDGSLIKASSFTIHDYRDSSKSVYLPGPDLMIGGVKHPHKMTQSIGCYNGALKYYSGSSSGKYGDKEELDVHGRKFIGFARGRSVAFFEDGSIQSIYDSLEFDFLGVRLLKASVVRFYPSGEIYSFSVQNYSPQRIWVQSSEIFVRNTVRLFENGMPMTLTAASRASFSMCDGTNIFIKPFDQLTFSESGCLKSVN